MPTQNDEPLNTPPDGTPPGQPPNKKSVLPGLIGFVFLALLVIGIAGAAWITQLRKKAVEPPPPIMGKVSAPTFIDDSGTSFSISQLDGRIWVVDFIFTRCGGQCPVMTVNMKKLQQWLEENENGGVKLVSITVDPENDTPAVMKRYAKNFKANEKNWYFLTGDRQTIYDYILNDFKLGVDENQGQPVTEMFVHSDKFVLVDKERNIRGYYSGTDENDMAKLRTALESMARVSKPIE